MANLFNKQAKLYSETRPDYPSRLFEFIASKTPVRDLVWDVGTGSGQAAVALAKIYKNVVGTDTSEQQLQFASKLPNIRYQQTSPNTSITDLERDVAKHETVDLVTVAQAIHWFDLPSFYNQVNWVLKKPNGVVAVWCYIEPEVNQDVDEVFWRLYKQSQPYWAPARKMVDDRYKTIDFPFSPIDGLDHTGPYEFTAKSFMDLDQYLTYIKSWSAYNSAHTQGVELLTKDVVKDFEQAWLPQRSEQKLVKYPVFLRIGKVLQNPKC